MTEAPVCFEAAGGRRAPRAAAPHLPGVPGPAARAVGSTDAGRAPTRLLTFSSLFPSQARPRHGIFVETRLRHLLHAAAFDARVIAPVPWFPFRSERFGSYAKFAATPRDELRGGLPVSYPRYLMLPKLGVARQPERMARAAGPELARLAATGWRPDLIDAHYFYPDGVAAALLAERLGRPFVVTARGTDVNVLAKLPGSSRRIAWAAERAAAIVTVSPTLKDGLVALGVDDAKITVLRNGVDLDMFEPVDRAVARRRLELAAEGPLLACVGNLVAEKGQALAIEALLHLPGHRLLLVGEGPLRAELESLGRALGVGERLVFRPSMPQRELASVYAAADAVLLLSTREGWPNVVLESMACGTPVIAMEVGAVGEMLTRPEVGRIVAAREARAVAAAVADLLAHGVAPLTIRAHAALYDWQTISRRLAELFAQVLHAGGAQAGAPRRGTAC